MHNDQCGGRLSTAGLCSYRRRQMETWAGRVSPCLPSGRRLAARSPPPWACAAAHPGRWARGAGRLRRSGRGQAAGASFGCNRCGSGFRALRDRTANRAKGREEHEGLPALWGLQAIVPVACGLLRASRFSPISCFRDPGASPAVFWGLKTGGNCDKLNVTFSSQVPTGIPQS
jgi:hypothetical protein